LLTEDIKTFYERTILVYGVKKWVRSNPPFDELIFTVLSQNTNSKNYSAAFKSLKDRFSSWEEALMAGEEEISLAIKSAGLHKIKARRIIDLIRGFRLIDPTLKLDVLELMSDNEALDFLMKFNGVKEKTAGCVLLFSLGRNVFPVDTHILRISKRFGLLPRNCDLSRAFCFYESRLHDADCYSFHINLVQHGREVCQSRRPTCHLCYLNDICAKYI